MMSRIFLSFEASDYLATFPALVCFPLSVGVSLFVLCFGKIPRWNYFILAIAIAVSSVSVAFGADRDWTAMIWLFAICGNVLLFLIRRIVALRETPLRKLFICMTSFVSIAHIVMLCKLCCHAIVLCGFASESWDCVRAAMSYAENNWSRNSLMFCITMNVSSHPRTTILDNQAFCLHELCRSDEDCENYFAKKYAGIILHPLFFSPSLMP